MTLRRAPSLLRWGEALPLPLLYIGDDVVERRIVEEEADTASKQQLPIPATTINAAAVFARRRLRRRWCGFLSSIIGLLLVDTTGCLHFVQTHSRRMNYCNLKQAASSFKVLLWKLCMYGSGLNPRHGKWRDVKGQEEALYRLLFYTEHLDETPPRHSVVPL